MTHHQPDPAPGAEPERGFVVAVLGPGVDESEELGELRELLRTAGVAPVGELVQRRPAPDPRTYVGKGKLEELKRLVKDAEAESLIVDDELDPGQQRRLEDALSARVVDRTQLILDIFAQHARSAEGKLQVELAQLEYNLPRMRGMWQHLERLGGGIGTRGPGESQLETDRRLARRRIGLLKRRLRELEQRRAVQRKARERSAAPVVALAGYTNAGKSTLLNALTDADASVDDRLFETLDPTTRGFEHDGRRYLVTDTVGLHPPPAAPARRGLRGDARGDPARRPRPPRRRRVAPGRAPGRDDRRGRLRARRDRRRRAPGRARPQQGRPRRPAAAAPARQPLPRRAADLGAGGGGPAELRARIAERFADRFRPVRLLVPYDDGRVLKELYDLGAPIEERVDRRTASSCTRGCPSASCRATRRT